MEFQKTKENITVLRKLAATHEHEAITWANLQNQKREELADLYKQFYYSQE